MNDSAQLLLRRMGCLAFLAWQLLGDGACATRAQIVDPGTVLFPPVAPEQVKIYAGEPPRPPHAVVGAIAVDDIGGGDEVALILRQDAARIGADAVIHLRLTKMMGWGPRTGLSGIAVRLNP